ncbi:MAG: Ig-like domain-containing protein [Propionibacteriaceae bacterium]|nr:Ig-like domain-containing protein [Propionibacteriaceae bacterium]
MLAVGTAAGAVAEETPAPDPSPSAEATEPGGPADSDDPESEETAPAETPELQPAGPGVVGASAGWADRGNDPVWGPIKLYQASVDTWAELKEALNAVPAYTTTAYVILINGDIEMTETYALTSKNIVLRKTISAVVYTDSGAGEYPWNYSNPYENTVVSDPTLYDRVADWKLTVASNIRHFSLAANGAVKLTLENITLDGGVEPDFTSAFDKGCFSMDGKNYTWTFSFAGNATRCHGYSTSYAKAGSGVFDGTNWAQTSTLEIRGGVFWKNSSTAYGGVIGTGWNSSYARISLRGYTRMQNNQALTFGGAIGTYQGEIVVTDNVLLQNNLARAGGAIITKGGALTISGNARITGNTADYNTTTASGDFRAGSGGGVTVAWQSGDYGVVTLADNASIDHNKATRAGGGLSISDVSAAADGTGIELHLLGGSITNNVATGETRTFAGTPSANELATIGSGGGIYMTHPKKIDLPANSTTSFSGNQAAFTAFIDNTDLQNLGSDMHAAVSFLAGDDYVSHIKLSEIPTSVVNQHGPEGNDFFNLYNNYDVGVPNNIPVGLYSKVNTAILPADGSGGNVVGDPGNAYVDPLNTGVKQAEVGTSLKYTPVAEPGWYLKEFTPVSDPALTSDELATAWTHDDAGVYTFKVPSVDTTLRATFHRKAVLASSPVVFPVNYSAGGYSPPGPQTVTLRNTTPAGTYSDSAKSVVGTLVDGDAALFTLTAPTALIMPGNANATWRVEPADSGFTTARTYSTTLQVTYNNGAEQETLSIPVSMEVADAGDLYLDGPEYDFGTSILAGGAYVPAVSAQTVTVTSVGGQIDATDAVVTLANQTKDGESGDWFTLTGGDLGTVASGSSKSSTTVQPKDLQPGVYAADVVLSYKVNGNPATKTAAGAVQFKVTTPAQLAVTDIDFGSQNIGYPSTALSYIPVALANSGTTLAQVTKIELTGANAASFRLAGADTGDGSEVVATVPVAGANSASWSIIPKADLAAGRHTAQVGVTYRTGVNDATATATANVAFTVVGPPSIVTQPEDASVFTNDRVTLSVDAANDPNAADALSYQWYSNQNNSNAGGTSLGAEATFPDLDVPTSNTGTVYYYCVVSSAAGSVVSAPAKVEVTGRTYTATLTPTLKTFAQSAYGYGPVAAQTFTFTSTANQTLQHMRAKFSGDNANAGWYEITAAAKNGTPLDIGGDTIDADTLAPGETFTLTARPVTGLSTGEHPCFIEFTWYGDDPGFQMVMYAQLAFTVVKATPQITWPTAPAITYGDPLPALTGGSDSGGGSFQWQDPTVVAPVTNSGYTVVLTPGDTDNYDYADVATTHITPVSVAPKQLTGQWSATAKTYDGTKAAQVVFTPDAEGVNTTFQASYADAAAGVAKPVTVSGIAVDNPNYLAPAAPDGLSADINQATWATPPGQSVDAVENTAQAYTVALGSLLPKPASPMVAGQVSYTIGDVSDTSGLLSGAPELALGGASASDDQLNLAVNAVAYSDTLQPASFPVTVHAANFADVTFQVEVRITSKTPVVISGVSISSKTYDGQPNPFSGTLAASPAGALEALTVSYSGRDGTEYGPTSTPPTAGGDYTLTIAVPAGNLEYKGAASWNFSINRKTVTVTANNAAALYKGALPTLGDADVTYAGFVAGDAATALLTRAVPALSVSDTLTVGTSPIGFGTQAELTTAAQANYTLEHRPGTLTISAVAPSAPGGFTATAGDGQVSLAWTTPDNGGLPISRYEVKIGTEAWVAIPDSNSGTVGYVATGLQNGTEYTFQVRAVSAQAAGQPSISAAATPKSHDASLVTVSGLPVGAVSANGTKWLPEQLSVQLPNAQTSVDQAALGVAQYASVALFTDSGYTSASAITLADVYPATYPAYVRVTAQDGTEAYYAVTLSRARASVAKLQLVAGLAPEVTAPDADPVEATLSVANGVFELKPSDLVAASAGIAELTDAGFANVLARQPLVVSVQGVTTDLYVRVTAQDGVTVKRYHIAVTRAPLTDTTLFYVGGQPVSFADPPAGQGTQAAPTLGQAVIPHNVDVLSATADGNIVPSDSATAQIVASNWKTVLPSVALVSAQTTDVYVVVTAQDLSTKQYYKISALREGSADTSLLAVAGQDVTLDAGHGQITVSWAQAELAAGLVEVAPGATVQLCADNTFTTGVPGGTLALAAGDNTAYILVTAEDGATTANYTIIVHRKNSDAGLADVLGQAVGLSAGGTSASTPASAQITVDGTVTELDIAQIAASDPHAGKLLYPSSGFAGTPVDSISLPPGTTNAWVRIQAEDTSYIGYYRIAVKRDLSIAAEILQVLGQPVTVISGNGAADAPFQVDIAVGAGQAKLTTADLVLSDGASTAVDADLAMGATTAVDLTVTAAAGNTAAYRLNVWRPADTSALASLLNALDNLIGEGMFKAYTVESLDVLKTAIANARVVVQDPNVTQLQVDAAKQEVEQAIAALQPNVPSSDATAQDLAEVQALVDYAARLDPADYTADSYAAVQDAVAAAQALLAQESPDAHDLADVKAELLEVLTGLRFHYTAQAHVNVGTSVSPVVVKKGKTLQLAGLGYVTSGKTEDLAYASSDPTVATVSATGLVKGKNAGLVQITASSQTPGADGQPVTVQIQVQVVSKPSSVKSTKADVPKTLAPGETVWINATWSKASAAPGKVTFSTSNKKIATVDKAGKLTAVAPGTVKIKVKAGSKSKTYTVRVALLETAKPKITGLAEIGVILSADPGVWGPGEVALSYQWYRSGKAITGATGPTYIVQPADKSKTLKVKVTGAKQGYQTASATSNSTRKVK